MEDAWVHGRCGVPYQWPQSDDHPALPLSGPILQSPAQLEAIQSQAVPPWVKQMKGGMPLVPSALLVSGDCRLLGSLCYNEVWMGGEKPQTDLCDYELGGRNSSALFGISPSCSTIAQGYWKKTLFLRSWFSPVLFVVKGRQLLWRRKKRTEDERASITQLQPQVLLHHSWSAPA